MPFMICTANIIVLRYSETKYLRHILRSSVYMYLISSQGELLCLRLFFNHDFCGKQRFRPKVIIEG